MLRGTEGVNLQYNFVMKHFFFVSAKHTLQGWSEKQRQGSIGESYGVS